MTDKEKNTIHKFRNTPIPDIFKLDNTDCILFLEDLDFDICKRIEKEKELSKTDINNIFNDYTKFTNLYHIGLDSVLDAYLLLVKEVIEIIKKYYGK